MFDNAIHKMNAAIYHRGPNNNGIWHDNSSGIIFGHQRLSILDLSKAGHQPMKSNSGRYILTYNGEIYNHLDLRIELEKKNPNTKWKGNSDTETFLEAIETWGLEFTLNKIVCMFAFGLWDKKTRSLILARDRMGEKPLYFGWQGEGTSQVFLFGSELKALKAHPQFKDEIDRDVVALQLRYNYIPAPYSIYKNIYKLLPGTFLHLEEKDLKLGLSPIPKPYWSLVSSAVDGIGNMLHSSKKEIQIELEQLLLTSIKQQMISDVPLGAFLSGGVDSSMIVALMQNISSRRVKTFTIGFDQNNYNEAKYAKKVAKHLGTEHTEMYVSPQQSIDVISKLPNIYDEPFSDSSQIPTFLISELAKSQVTVSLSGDGGDELFCGYNRYIQSKRLLKNILFLPLSLRKFLAKLIQAVPAQKLNKIFDFLSIFNRHGNIGDKLYKGAEVLDSTKLSDIYFKLVSNWQNSNQVVIGSKKLETYLSRNNYPFLGLDEQQKMMVLDCITYLPDDILVKVDRAAMASSLEVRNPFLDHRIIEYAWKIPQYLKLNNGQSKRILRDILYQYVPKNLIERPKMGFAIPIDEWLRGSLRDWAESLLNEKSLKENGYFETRLILNKWEEHLSGKKNYQNQLWSVLMFQSWYKKN